MSTGDDSLSKILRFILGMSIIVLLAHIYWYCHFTLARAGLTAQAIDDFLRNFNGTSGLFKSAWSSKFVCVALLLMFCFATKGKPTKEIKAATVASYAFIGVALFFGSNVLLTMRMSATTKTLLYCSVLIAGYLSLLSAFVLISRLLNKNLMHDRFNVENESFIQETRWISNAKSDIPTIHLPTEFYYKGKWNKGWINVVNPHRATAVLGTPGSGKSYAVINSYIKQLIEQGNALYVYDYKFPALTEITFNHYRMYPHGYKQNKPKVYILNFDDPRKSHRCNPLNPKFLTDIADANESSFVIMMNLNKTWIQKQGDFFVGSAITLLTAIIWFLRCYKEGKYCTFPHAVELVNQPYEKWFPILMSYSDLDAFMTNFVNSFENGAMEQLQGQVASVQIAVSMLVSPRVYWTMSGNDFSFDINNPDEPKILCVGNNPERESVYAAALGLVNARIVQLTNKQDKMPCGIIVDELPTMYFRKIDNLINTARSNKVAICLGFQDNSQLKRDYGDKEYEVIVSTIGNLFSGQVLGNTAKSLQERYGKVLQERQSISVNRNDTSTSYSTQMDYLIPAGKIANLRQGTFVGNVVEDLKMVDERGKPIEGMVQNIFHAKIIVDHSKVQADEKRYQKLPIITDFTQQGEDCMDKIISGNFQRIKADVKQIIADELERIDADPSLQHLLHKE
ncbi:MAG: YWFCY domain-containing protein [Prevotellaceae bacterium]|jgi:hypothetical protein|nr:YWFCY domain-containing protein [Prevotellaceae bacterium]